MKKILARISRYFLKRDPIINFIKEYQDFLRKGKVKESHQRILREAAFHTQGHILDVASLLARRNYGEFQHSMKKTKSLIGLSQSEIGKAKESLLRDGFWIAPRKVPHKLLAEFHEAAMREFDNKYSLQQTRDEMMFLGKDWVMQQTLPNILATSWDIYSIVGDYLGVEPVLNLPESWFSFPVSQISSQSAQNWHWDCDRIRWIKVFVYINDVNLSNGPHAFIRGSHRNWRIDRKSSRFTEEEVREMYSAEDFQVFTAKKGTIIFEDTRGLHKGTPLIKDYRLILQLEFSVDTFGYIHTPTYVPEDFKALYRNYPRMLSGTVIQG
jgi:Phytanoyl-CoA dioxygenase (PhyH)